MRAQKFVWAIALFSIFYAADLYSKSAESNKSAAAQAKSDANGDSQDGADDADQKNEAPPAKGGIAAKEHLLPERPKDFNPMIPPAEMGAAGMGGAEGDSFQPWNSSGILIAEVRQFTEQLALFSRALMMMAAGGIMLLIILAVYVRNAAAAALRHAQAASASAMYAEQLVQVTAAGSQKQLRAYVQTNGAKGEMPAEKTGKYTVRVEVKNFGTTPAYALSGNMAVFVGDMIYEKDIALSHTSAENVETVLPPGGTYYYYARSADPIAHEARAISASVRAIYVYGEMRYKDTYGLEHRSRFRFKCSGERNFASGTFDLCIAGNEAD